MASPKSLEKRIVEEIAGKVDDYESRMSNYMSSIGEWDDLFRIRRPARKKNTFSNPRLTEFHRATIALGTLLYRMMTAKDPFFSVVPMDTAADPFDPMAPFMAYERAQTVQHAMLAQFRAARYRQNLLKATMFCLPFGTVVAQEDYGVVGVNARGRRIPVTHFRPRVMDQVAFESGTSDIDSAGWLATMDVVSNAALYALLNDAELVGAPYKKDALKAAIDMKEGANTINNFVLNRLRRSVAGASDEVFSSQKELLVYYGKLDALNDGLEYVAAIVNRKVLVRFHANEFQHGKRNFRIAKWIDWAGPLGLGLGDILGNFHKSMDANRQKAQDNITFNVYSPWKRRRNTVNDDDLTIRPMKLIDVEDPSDLTPLETSTNGARASLDLETLLRNEFRQASGAHDTLQAILTDATATEVSLAQNEALRRVSVSAEMIAESLVREHLDVSHANNSEFITQPFNVNRAGIAQTVYPADFRFDADFELLLTIDKDYKPQRLEKLIQALQIITSTKSQHPELSSVPVSAIANEILYMLDVPVKKWLPGGPMAAVPADAQALASLASQSVPSVPGFAGEAQPSGFDILGTPVGPVAVSPAGGGMA